MNCFRKLATTFLVVTLFYSTQSWSANTTHDVIVVGAGSAGLYAARNLVDEGYQVLIIEAAGRIGGRVYSQTLGNTRIEMGAEEHYLKDGNNPVWPAIRGKFGNSVYVEAYQGSEVYSMDGGKSTCWSGGGATLNCGNDADVGKFLDFYDSYWMLNQHPNPNNTMRDFVRDDYSVNPGDRDYHVYENYFAGGVFATNLDKLGARSLALQDNQWDLSEGVMVIGDPSLGYSDALQTVWWDDLLLNAKTELLLESAVVAIDTSGDDVVVTDINGDLHAARQVIVTVSIGVLQAEKIDFVPDLPTATIAAYNGIGIDQGMKVAMRFALPWWKTRGDTNLGWLVTEGLAGACWVPSDYKVGSKDHILMCYPMGENARELNAIATAAVGDNSGVGDQAIIDAILADLDQTFPSAPNAASANFREGKVKNWGADPYQMGVYSYPKIGTYTSANKSRRLDLQAPVASNRVFFAGEGTHHTHPSTVVGALHEGERAAIRVDSVNGKPNNPPELPGPDETPPELSLAGEAEINLYQHSPFIDLGASAVDDRDGDLTSSINLEVRNQAEVLVSSVDSSLLGEVYTLTYLVSDGTGNLASAIRTVAIIRDDIPPSIIMNGAITLSIVVGERYDDLGASASDNVDGDITAQIEIVNNVVNTEIGSYQVVYSVTDRGDNTSQAIRSVSVTEFVDLIAPILTLNGEDTLTLELGDTYKELGATAIDDIDGNISSKISISGSVNTAVAGNYSIVYSVSDVAGNAVSETRKITVRGITLTPDSAEFIAGHPIVIHYNEGSGSKRDWIGLYLTGSEPSDGRSHRNYLDWAYTNGKSGTASFDALSIGDYTAILFSKNSWNFYGESATFSVIADPEGPPIVADVITILKAEFKRKKGELKVQARSSDGTSVNLTVVDFGPMKAKKKKFEFKQKGVDQDDIPLEITIISSKGGTASKQVKIK